MSQYVCNVAGLSEKDGSALCSMLQQLEPELEAQWRCSPSPAEPFDVELVDIDEELGKRLWRPQSRRFPVSVACTGSHHHEAEWMLPKPIEVDHVASLFKDLGDTLRPRQNASSARAWLPSILVVHGNPAVLETLRDSLFVQRERFHLVTASSGKEAIQLLRMTNIALAVIVMPVRNGFELLAALADKHPHVLRLVCGGQGAGPWQIRVRSRTSFSSLRSESSVQVLGEALLSVMDLKPADSGFLHSYSTWSSPWPRPSETPAVAAPQMEEKAAEPRRPSLREMLAAEEVEFELSHLRHALIDIPAAPSPEPQARSHHAIQSEPSFEELAEDGFAAFREKDFARAEECWKKALDLRPADGRLRYNLRLAQSKLSGRRAG